MAETAIPKDFDPSSVITPINGDPAGKHFLSMHQLSHGDIEMYIEEARAAEAIINHPDHGGIPILQFKTLTALMRQESTRTMGSMGDSMTKLGGNPHLIGGMKESSESKGESPAGSVLAIATHSDVIGTRTKKEHGPHYAADVIDRYFKGKKLDKFVPVINLGDGTNEHPSQTMGDFFTIQRHIIDAKRAEGLDFGFKDLTIAIVGDHERYRGFHSLLIGIAELGMRAIVVESPAAPLPKEYGGSHVDRTDDLNGAMMSCDVFIPGRQPDEYDGEDPVELERSQVLGQSYREWYIDSGRLQQMRPDAKYMNFRPARESEVSSNIDFDPRAIDVSQMAKMVPMRMAIIALAMGRSIKTAVDLKLSER